MPDIQAQLQRIEDKLDALIACLAEDDDAEPAFDLDGQPIPAERDPGQPL